jgi:hypothetical protein
LVRWGLGLSPVSKHERRREERKQREEHEAQDWQRGQEDGQGKQREDCDCNSPWEDRAATPGGLG